MSRRPTLPSYRKHKQSGRAIVTFRLPSGKRKDYLLGPYGSKESKTEYARLVAEFQAAGGSLSEPTGPVGDLTINELLVRYLRHCDAYYRHADGRPTGQAAGVRYALRALMGMYGHTQARDFGPLALKAVRAALVEAGNSRKTVNLRVGLVRQFFKWCVAEELVPSSVYEALRTVAGLQPGRTAAPDRIPVRPAAGELVEAALPFMPPPVAALVRLQLLSGARGGELLGLRAADICRSGPVWVYRPPQHKNAWRTRSREVFFGPKAQEVLRPWMERSPDAPLFSPAVAEAERNASRAVLRRTPRWPSHNRYTKARRAKRRSRSVGTQYTAAAYRQAIERACERAYPLPEQLRPKRIAVHGRASRREKPAEWRARLGPEGSAEVRAWRKAHTWTPHQLRHAAGTAIRKEFGIELARIILGHSTAFTTEIYAETDREQARDVVAKIG
jgi:integrase